MYDVDKCSAVLKNTAGLYIRSCNKMVALGYIYTL